MKLLSAEFLKSLKWIYSYYLQTNAVLFSANDFKHLLIIFLIDESVKSTELILPMKNNASSGLITR